MSLFETFRIPCMMKPVVIHPIYSESASGIYLASIRKENLKHRIERNKKRIALDEAAIKELEELGAKWAEQQEEKMDEIRKFGEV